MIDPVPKCLGYIQGILQHHSGRMHVGRLGGYIRCNPFLYAYLWKEDYYSNKGTMDNSERKKYMQTLDVPQSVLIDLKDWTKEKISK